MKIVYISASDIHGGAARATYRLYTRMRSLPLSVEMFVLNKGTDDPDIYRQSGFIGKLMPSLSYRLDALPLCRYPPRDVFWSLNWFPYPIASTITQQRPDLLHLHWIGSGFIPIRALGKISKPIVWTLHDEWAFTGGCHYSFDCNGYKTGCGACPQLRSNNKNDVSRKIWNHKNNHWRNLNLTIVSPSRWLAERTHQSALFAGKRVEVIPNGIDIHQYKPLDQSFARQTLNLPLDKQLILFGALSSTGDKRKGFEQLRLAIQKLAGTGWTNRAELVVFGNSDKNSKGDLGLKTHYVGRLQDDITLALAYSAADVFVAPSLQDNLPNTIMEALACGTPSVGFDIGGIPDLIEHQRNGYLARPYEVDDLANGIDWVLSDYERHQRLSARAREKVEAEFDIRHIAQKYLALYNEILESDSVRTRE